LAFRLRPIIEWTHEKWAALEGLAQEFGLTIDVENAIHLQEGPEKKEIASIHEIGVENDLCIIPDYARGNELLEAIGSRIFGARTGEEP
jgi:hypothetical protein